ncbi:hypothetical protein [Fulvivirga sedimenti]|uniref:Lipoprotein n=1 Tax=Fulvivirga sedimenti TaxID=2879465 RepID=A0A9X1HYG0_9BACT|nr:hypothetical protein [Fulvivirga sedimenti]MCA6078749.1 hypothetical protein [Fulvivirga sedimenti]
MRWVPLLLIVLSAGCASSQDKQAAKGEEWKVKIYEHSVLKGEWQNDRLQVEIVEGTSRVLVFERTVGNIAVDAGYMERIWLEVSDDKSRLEINPESSAFYERVCRCENNGFHRIISGDFRWDMSEDTTLHGNIEVKMDDQVLVVVLKK